LFSLTQVFTARQYRVPSLLSLCPATAGFRTILLVRRLGFARLVWTRPCSPRFSSQTERPRCCACGCTGVCALALYALQSRREITQISICGYL